MAAVTHYSFGAHDLLVWAVIGFIAGIIAGKVVYGHGFGCFANIMVGLAGALIGGLILAEIGPSSAILGSDTLDDIVVSFVGSVLLLTVVRLLTPKSHRRR